MREVFNPVCRRLCSYDSLLASLPTVPSLCMVHARSLVACVAGMSVSIFISLNSLISIIF